MSFIFCLNVSNQEKFQWLFIQEHMKIIHCLASFIHVCFEKMNSNST